MPNSKSRHRSGSGSGSGSKSTQKPKTFLNRVRRWFKKKSTRKKSGSKNIPLISLHRINTTVKRSSRRSYNNTSRKIKQHKELTEVIQNYLEQSEFDILNGTILNNTYLKNHIFNPNEKKCICENINNNQLQNQCLCTHKQIFPKQGMSGASIYSIECRNTADANSEEKYILKTMDLDDYYIKMRTQTKKYIFLEMDFFTIQTIINTFVYKELPYNAVNIYNSGICNKETQKKTKFLNHFKSNKPLVGYNLMEQADLGTVESFIHTLLSNDNTHDLMNKIKKSVDSMEISIELRDKIILNCLLQCILIIGHLQSSSLEFFHGDYKPDNVFVKTLDKSKVKEFKYNINGNDITLPNMGFAVLIADFDRSSISINSSNENKKYRIVSPILFKPLLKSYVDYTIKKYGDDDPNDQTTQNNIQFDKYLVYNVIPKSKNPSITILRSAGVTLFRDLDLYTFFIKLIETQMIYNYIIMSTKIYIVDLLSFISNNFLSNLILIPKKTRTLNESAYIAIKIFHHINEPMKQIFTDEYIDKLLELCSTSFQHY